MSSKRKASDWIDVQLWATPAMTNSDCMALAPAFVTRHATLPNRAAVLKLKERASGSKTVIVAVGRRQGQKEAAHVSQALFDRVSGSSGKTQAKFREASWFDLLRYRSTTRIGVAIAVLSLIATILSAVLAFVGDEVWWLAVAVLAAACLSAVVTAYRDLGKARSLSC
jgi:hypothetical protein